MILLAKNEKKKTYSLLSMCCPKTIGFVISTLFTCSGDMCSIEQMRALSTARVKQIPVGINRLMI